MSGTGHADPKGTKEAGQQQAGPAGAPLEGIRVVTLEHAVAGPLCSRHLADLGADVIKVEHPSGGDLARRYDTVVKGESAYFVWANRGKRSVALDLRSDEGRETLAAILDGADVFLHNLGPGAVDRLGFGADVITRRWPRLIACGISGYGADGPYRDRKAFDLLIQGEAGLLSLTGSRAEPAKVGISVADMCAAVYALSAILAALLARASSGFGQVIDISMLECLAEWMMAPAYHQIYGGHSPSREGARHNMMVPYGVYRTGADGRVNFSVQTDRHWRALCVDVLHRPELVEDPRFVTNEVRVRNREHLEPQIEECFAGSDAATVSARLVAAGIPTGDVNDLRGLVDHPQLAARSRWFETDSPGGWIQALKPPFNLVDQPGTRGVPRLGEHTEEVLAETARDVPRLPGPAPY